VKRSEAAELVMMLMGAFPNAKTSESTSQVYETLLVDLDVAVARRAVARLVATSRFLPSIAEIREASAAIVQSERARLARERAARIPSLPRARIVQLERYNRAAQALVVSNGAAGAAVVPADPAQQKPAAPVDLVHRIAAKAPPAAPPREARRWTAEELDAELARTAGCSTDRGGTW